MAILRGGKGPPKDVPPAKGPDKNPSNSSPPATAQEPLPPMPPAPTQHHGLPEASGMDRSAFPDIIQYLESQRDELNTAIALLRKFAGG